jgi:hypothetical protein
MSSQDRLASRTEFRLKLEKVLEPYKNHILLFDSILLWEKPALFVGLLVGVQIAFWLNCFLLQRLSIVTLVSLAVGASILLVKFSKFLPLKVSEPEKVAGRAPRHEYDDILNFISAIYFLVVESIDDAKNQLQNSSDFSYAAKLGGVVVFFAILGAIFSTWTLLWIAVNIFLIAPGFFANAVHKRIYAISEPHLQKVWPHIEPHYRKTIEPQWKKIEPQVAPYLEKAANLSKCVTSQFSTNNNNNNNNTTTSSSCSVTTSTPALSVTPSSTVVPPFSEAPTPSPSWSEPAIQAPLTVPGTDTIVRNNSSTDDLGFVKL